MVPPRRRLLVGMLLATALVLVLDLLGGPGPSVVRSAGGLVLGPVERLLGPGHRSAAEPVDAVRLSADHAAAAARAHAAQDLVALTRAPETRGRSFVGARVVAVGRQGVRGPERVTIDAGSRDGVRAELSVVDADGLVGRVIAVSPWTSDVLLLGARGFTVGVRVGPAGTLGSVTGTSTGRCPAASGQLAVEVVQRGRFERGAVVTTLGSVGGTPFPTGLRVGTVSAVHTAPGQLVPSGCVVPAVDVATLDVVGVLVGSPRSTPRAPATGPG